DVGHAYKAINAPFGPFSSDTLKASTAALASTSAGDATYTQIEAQLMTLMNARDALANQMRAALNGAEFGGTKIQEKQAKDWIAQANDLLAQAQALAASLGQ